MGSLFGNLTNAAPVNEGMGPQPIQPGKANIVDRASLPQVEQPRPTLAEAANTGVGGTPNALSPSLSKGGKLVTLLTAAAKGGLAAGGQKTVGGGYQAGSQIPFIEAMQRGQLQSQQGQNQLQQAQIQNIPFLRQQAQAGLAHTQAQTALYNAQADKADRDPFVTNPYVDFRSGDPVERANALQYLQAQHPVKPVDANSITLTPEIAGKLELPPEFIGKQMTLPNLAALNRSIAFENVPQMTAQGPILVSRKTAKAQTVSGSGGQTFSPPALASPREVADENNPGQTITLPAGQTMGKPGVQSASVQVPKKAAAAEVPSNIGDQKVAFQTMIAHADLLRQAAKALNNGDQQTLAGLKNKFKNEFGYSGPITAQAIADAYGGEVTNVIAKGHITNQEIEKTGRTLNPNKQNYATIDDVLNGYQALAQSKMNMLNKQKQSAVQQSQPNSKNTSSVDDLIKKYGGR